MEDIKLVSVIVPVYNVENYIKRCLDSIILQTYKSIEIILVDDGATDKSGIICDEYAGNDSRISVIHKANGGLSDARNIGLDNAKGDYIFFVDSDDYIATDTIEKLMDVAVRTGSNVVACGIEMVWDSSNHAGEPFTCNRPGEWTGRESVIEMEFNNSVCSVAWNKLYEATVWNGLRFPVGKLHEDEYTVYKALFKASRVSYIPDTLYKYYQRSDGISAGTTNDDRNDHLDAFYERYSFFLNISETELAEWAMVKYLEYIKYLFRNSHSDRRREELIARYKKDCRRVMHFKHIGLAKKCAILAWKYKQY